ncbi:MAG: hypothetical protein AAB074_02995 [Planctomycetota bacterium]
MKQDLDALVPLLEVEALRRRNSLPAHEVSQISAKAKGIIRRSQFIDFQFEFLKSVKWSEAYDLGSPQPSGRLRSTFVYQDCEISLASLPALLSFVYLTFDGLVAGCSNMTDGLSRILNDVYHLGLNPKGVNLFLIERAISKPCAIKNHLVDPGTLGWLNRIRDLRGRCQHADLESVIVQGKGPIANLPEPFIPAEFRWDGVLDDESISSFAAKARDSANQAVLKIVALLKTSPSAAIL